MTVSGASHTHHTHTFSSAKKPTRWSYQLMASKCFLMGILSWVCCWHCCWQLLKHSKFGLLLERRRRTYRLFLSVSPLLRITLTLTARATRKKIQLSTDKTCEQSIKELRKSAHKSAGKERQETEKLREERKKKSEKWMEDFRTGFCLSGQRWRELNVFWKEGACLLLIWHGCPAEREMQALSPVIINKDKENIANHKHVLDPQRGCKRTHTHMQRTSTLPMWQVWIFPCVDYSQRTCERHPSPLQAALDLWNKALMKEQTREVLTAGTRGSGKTSRSCGWLKEVWRGGWTWASGRVLATSWLPRLLIELPLGQLSAGHPTLAHQSIHPVTQPEYTSVDDQAEK